MAETFLDQEEFEKKREKEYQYVREVLDFGWHNTKSAGFVRRLEEKFAEVFGVKYAISNNSGTGTMHTCLAAAGIGPGDEVIVPALTMASTALVVIHHNAVPVFADIDPETFEIDPSDVRRRITPYTKAIIPVSLYGMAPDMDVIMEIAREHNLVVIEDDAQCFLGRYKGRLVGTIGDMASFSFQGSKHMTSGGDGGMVITDNEEYARLVRKASVLGYSTLGAKAGSTSIPREIRQDPNFERHDLLGWNYRLPELSAAVGLAQLERLKELVGWRQDIAKMYAEVIDGCSWLVPQKVPGNITHTYYIYAVLLKTEKKDLSWRTFRDKYVEFGGEPIYGALKPVHLEPVFREEKFYGKGCPNHCPLYQGTSQKYEKGLCPVCEKVQPNLFCFKTHYKVRNDKTLGMRQMDALAATIAYFAGTR